MTDKVRFDDSLPQIVNLVAETWGPEAVERNLFLRDGAGRLTVVVLEQTRTGEERTKLSVIAATRLGAYVDQSLPVGTPEELFDDSLKQSSIGLVQHIKAEKYEGPVRLLDRRVFGADWLRPPRPLADGPPRLVFTSLKGGVGRSTALCVFAAHLAANGRRVLALDLDVEAPGLGSMLLAQDTAPKFGLLDYLVEITLNDIDDSFYSDMIGPSWLSNGAGIVSVIPAIGTLSLAQPGNVLSKISRAYLDHIDSNGISNTVADRVINLLDKVSSTNEYDVILIDTRAGLHETTGFSITALGAHVFMFGINQPQTVDAYNLLLANLGLLPRTGWQKRINFVHAKASLNEKEHDEFASTISDLIASHLSSNQQYDLHIDLEKMRDVFEIEWIDSSDPGNEIADDAVIEAEETSVENVSFIVESEQFRDFNPLQKPDRLTFPVYDAVFGRFLERAMRLTDAAETEAETHG